jgi:broad specificity phosphatase PhoE
VSGRGPASAPRLWAIRHGETEWSRSGRHTGRTDLPLTAAGRREAEALGKLLAAERFAQVLSSPLRRARETCELAGLGARARIEPDLAEWDYGEYEGLTTEAIQRASPGWTVWEGSCPGGESAAQVGARADRVIAGTRGSAGDVVLFAHAHVLRVLAARWLCLGPSLGRCFALDTAAFGILGLEHGTPVLRLWNARSARPPGAG